LFDVYNCEYPVQNMITNNNNNNNNNISRSKENGCDGMAVVRFREGYDTGGF